MTCIKISSYYKGWEHSPYLCNNFWNDNNVISSIFQCKRKWTQLLNNFFQQTIWFWIRKVGGKRNKKKKYIKKMAYSLWMWNVLNCEYVVLNSVGNPTKTWIGDVCEYVGMCIMCVCLKCLVLCLLFFTIVSMLKYLSVTHTGF